VPPEDVSFGVWQSTGFGGAGMNGQVRSSIIHSKSHYLVFLSFLSLTAILVLLANLVYSAEVTLVWDPNTEKNVAGYRLHYGFETRKYIYDIDVGDQTSYMITGLDPGTTVFFAATAYDIYGNKSDYSEELAYLVPQVRLPVANAGPDQSARAGDLVTLDGSASVDLDHGIASYHWSQIGGPPVILAEPGKAETTLTVPEDAVESESLVFKLLIVDEAGFESEDTCVITVSNRTTYEDGEGDTTDGWTIYDSKPSGAAISNVYDEDLKSWVIELWGAGTKNGYRLGNRDGSKWRNMSQFVVQWRIKTNEDFKVYLDVETNSGHRYIYYKPDDSNRLGRKEYVHHGLGSHVRDGKWHTFTRCLQTDLSEAQPGVRIEEVNGFLIRGNVRVDDIRLMTYLPGETVYEDAEDGKTNRWHIYDDDPPGAMIENVYDEDRGSRVIELSGSERSNGYTLRNEDGIKWHNSTQCTIEWSMSYSERLTLYVNLETTSGYRQLYYSAIDNDELGQEKVIRYGLGSGATDGNWRTFTRNLQSDLEKAQPGVKILEVNGFDIRGSGRVDDIKLKGK